MFARATFPTRLAEFRFEAPEALLAIRSPWIVRVAPTFPTLVILGWDPWLTTMATLACATFPTRLAEFRFEAPEALLAMRSPWTVIEFPSEPTLVILGWDPWLTTRATLACATLPTRFAEFRFEIPYPLLAIRRPWTVSEFPIEPTDVMLG
jgi:hypothetical protein